MAKTGPAFDDAKGTYFKTAAVRRSNALWCKKQQVRKSQKRGTKDFGFMLRNWNDGSSDGHTKGRYYWCLMHDHWPASEKSRWSKRETIAKARIYDALGLPF